MAQSPMKVRIDEAALKSVYDDMAHIKNGAPRAMTRAINHTLGVVRTEAGKEIRKQVKLPAAYVREKLKVAGATFTRPRGSIKTPTRGSLLTRYPHREYAKGDIGVQVKPLGGYKRMPSAFFIDLPTGRDEYGEQNLTKAIAIRTVSGPGLGRSEGIKILYGPSTSQVFTDVKDDLQEPSGNRLMQRLAYEADRLLAQQ